MLQDRHCGGSSGRVRAQRSRREFGVATDHDVARRGSLPNETRVVIGSSPQGRSPIEVQDRPRFAAPGARLASRGQDRQDGRASRFGRKHRRRDDHETSQGQGFDGRVGEGQLRVGCRIGAIERHRKVVRWPGFEERDLGSRSGPAAEPVHVDPGQGQVPPDVVAVAVVADSRDDRRRDTKAGEPGPDVSGEPTHGPNERAGVGQRRPGRIRSQVDPDPADDEGLGHWQVRITPGASGPHPGRSGHRSVPRRRRRACAGRTGRGSRRGPRSRC